MQADAEGSKDVIFQVATKHGEPFAVLVIRGDDHTSSLHAMPLVPPWRSTPGIAKTEKIENAVDFAMQILGIDRSSLRASGYREPQVQEAAIPDHVTYEELPHLWRSVTEISGVAAP